MTQTEQALSVPQQTWVATPSPILTIRSKPVRPWLVLVSLLFGYLMSLLDATIVNIAVPAIQTNLKTDLASVSWILSAYSMVFATFMVIVGRFADQYGRKRIFLAGMLLFTLSSLGCGFAQTLGMISGLPAIVWLIGFRTLQAIGGAGLASADLAIVMAVFPPEKRGAAIGISGALGGLASAIGPVIGGFLVQTFDWRWIFFVNLPFCLIGLVMVLLFVPETCDPQVSKHFDVFGMIKLTITIFTLVLAIIEGNTWGWSSLPIRLLLSSSAIGLILFVIIELRQREPIVDFKLFKSVSFTGANITMFLFSIAIQGSFVITVMYFTRVRGYSELNTAYAFLPIPLASLLISLTAGRFSRKINPHIMGLTGLTLLVAGFSLLGLLSPYTSYVDIAWRSLLIGAGMGMIFQTQPSISLSSVPRAKLGMGSGVFNTSRQLGSTLGVAILISIFAGQLSTNLGQAQTTALITVQNDTKLPESLRIEISNDIKGMNIKGVSSHTLDLMPLAEKIPSNTSASVKNTTRLELKSLEIKIGHEFAIEMMNSFKLTWLFAAFFAFAGLLSAFYAAWRSHSLVQEQTKQMWKAS